jgi:glycosyltransferase involved in cell wall biosynthesis
MNKIKVSIVIPAYNEEKYIGGCLDAIAKQEYSNYEIILVDNGSSDKTIKIATDYEIEILQNASLNISGLRNLGASKARGNILIFIDSDCIPVKDWLFNGILRLQDKNVGVTGAACSMPPKSTWVEKAWYSSKPKGVREVNFLGTANMFVWKELFDRLSGFNKELRTGEDYEFCNRVKRCGYKVVSDDDIKVFHLRGPRTLIERLKKEIWYGVETKKILKLNKIYLPFIASIIYIIFIVLLLVSIFWGNHLLSLFSIGTIISLLIMISFYRCYINRQFKYFLYLIPIYLFYLTGRSLSLIYFLKKNS